MDRKFAALVNASDVESRKHAGHKLCTCSLLRFPEDQPEIQRMCIEPPSSHCRGGGGEAFKSKTRVTERTRSFGQA